MKKPLFSPPPQAALDALTTLCVAFGCAWPLSQALGLTVSGGFLLLVCGAAALVFLAAECVPILRALVYPAALIAVVLVGRHYLPQAQAFSRALTLLFSGQPLALAAYSRAAAVLLAVLFSALGAALSGGERALLPVTLLAAAVLLAVSFLGAQIEPLSMLPLALAALLSCRLPGVGASRILPCAALVLLLTLPLVPAADGTLPALTDFAARLRQAVDDYFFFTDARTAFSLTSTGYQPLGADRLGGTASPTDAPVMQVQTSGRTLLRAIVKNEYTGAAWRDSASGRRYLFVNPRFLALRRDLFDQARPPRDVRATLPAAETIRVLMRQDATSTLYLTQRFSGLSGRGLVPYYSPASEVFGTRSLAVGDAYTFSGTRLGADTPGIRAAVLAAYDPDDPNLAAVRETYTALPAGVESGVFALALELTDGRQNDFDRALALCTHLQTAYPYTLEQSAPPAGRDFVSWFLLSEQKGYCTSFASAMAVLARIVGLPARYIEGYVAEPDADDVARVTQKHAHAWTEIYFPGFGWLTFDPTPGASGAQEAPDGSDGTDGSDDPDDGGENPPPDAPPEGTPEPTPTPSPTPTPVPTPTASPTPEHDDPSVTPTPEISPEPTPAPTPEPTPEPPDAPDDPDKPKGPPPALIASLLLLLAAALCALRLYLASPARMAKGKEPGEAALVYYGAVTEALLARGIAPAPGEAPATFLSRAQEQTDVSFAPLARALYAARYGPRRLRPAHAARAARAYEGALATLRLKQRAGLYARRLLHGAPKVS